MGQIANSLVFDADGAPLLVLTSGAHRVDTGKVAALVGARPGAPGDARSSCGRRPGRRSAGSPRSGTRRRCARWSTATLAEFDEVWAAGGIAHAVFPTTFAELVAVTGGEPADVA